MEPSHATNPFQEILNKTNEAFSNLAEGQIFTEDFKTFFVVAIIRKNLAIIYQGTQAELQPICYTGIDEVRRKFSYAQQSGYWVNYVKTDKEFSDKLLND